MVYKCFNIYNCTVKSIKEKEAPPSCWLTCNGNQKTESYAGWKWGLHWEVL